MFVELTKRDIFTLKHIDDIDNYIIDAIDEDEVGEFDKALAFKKRFCTNKTVDINILKHIKLDTQSQIIDILIRHDMFDNINVDVFYHYCTYAGYGILSIGQIIYNFAAPSDTIIKLVNYFKTKNIPISNIYNPEKLYTKYADDYEMVKKIFILTNYNITKVYHLSDEFVGKLWKLNYDKKNSI